MPRKGARRSNTAQNRIVDFDFQDRKYQIDPQRGKVYRRFVEIETSKAFEIFSHWRALQIGA